MSRTYKKHAHAPSPHRNRGIVHVALEATGDMDGTEGRILSRHRSPEAAQRAAGRHARRLARAGFEGQVTTAQVIGRPSTPVVRSRDSLPLAPQEAVDSTTPPTPRGIVRGDALANLEAAVAAMRTRRSA